MRNIQKRQIYIILGLLIFGGAKHSYGQIISTISVEFEREYTNKNKKECLKGQLFYKAPSRIIVRIKNPVNQWIIYEKNEMTIYYPDENRAFHFISQFPLSLPFFQPLINVTKEDFGLSDLGYTLEKYERKGANLFSIWIPPKNASKFLGEFSLEYQDNKLIFSEIKNAKGKIISKSFYKNHIRYGYYFLPMEISITYYSNSQPCSELVKFINPHFNSTFPQEVMDFKIPENTKVKEIIW